MLFSCYTHLMSKPKVKKLPNGMRVLLVPLKDQRTATVLVLAEAGSKYETKERNGISHFLEHLCFKGTTMRPSPMIIASELDSLGAEYNAFTMHEVTGFHAKVASHHLPSALDLVADLYVDPIFKGDDIETEKGVIVGEIDMRNDMLPRRAGEIFMELLYGDQPAGWPIAGQKEGIRRFMLEDFLDYRRSHYVAKATTVIVAGKFSEKKIEKMITEKFSTLSRSKKPGKQKVEDVQACPAVRILYKECDQTHLVLGFRSLPLTHPSYTALNVMASVLGGGMSSRLFHKIRTEMGAGYYAHSGNDSYSDHGMFVSGVGSDHSKVKDVIRAILAEYRRLRTDLVPEVELSKVKDMLAGRLALGLEGSDEIGEYYGFQEVLKGKIETPEEAIKKMNAVSAEEIRALAKKIFVPEHLNLAMIGPWKNEKEFLELLQM